VSREPQQSDISDKA